MVLMMTMMMIMVMMIMMIRMMIMTMISCHFTLLAQFMRGALQSELINKGLMAIILNMDYNDTEKAGH